MLTNLIKTKLLPENKFNPEDDEYIASYDMFYQDTIANIPEFKQALIEVIRNKPIKDNMTFDTGGINKQWFFEEIDDLINYLIKNKHMTKTWQEEYRKKYSALLWKYDLNIKSYKSCGNEIEDYIQSILDKQKQEILEEVENIPIKLDGKRKDIQLAMEAFEAYKEDIINIIKNK